MNATVRGMIKDALKIDGVEEIFKLSENNDADRDLFDKDYLDKIK